MTTYTFSLNKYKSEKACRVFLLVILIGLFAYIAYRAYSLSLTHDEALSYQIILGDKHLSETANNHFLNTILMKACYLLFGDSELSLRLPNVLAFLLYAYAYFEIFKKKHFVIILVSLSFLFFNPYLLDFFSLARGYGLALGMFMMSLLYLLQTIESTTLNNHFKYGCLSLLFSIAASFSNLCYINANLIVAFLIVFSFFFVKKDGPVRRKLIVLFVSIILINICCLFFLVITLLKLNSAQELYFGGSSFVQDTIGGLIRQSFYSNYSAHSEILITLFTSFLFILFFVILFYSLYIRKYSRLIIIIVFLSLITIASFLQHSLFHTPFPLNRTALIFIPLGGLLVSFFFEEMQRLIHSLWVRKTVYAITLVLFFVPLTLHFLNSINTRYCHEWPFDSNTKEVVSILNDTTRNNSSEQHILSYSYVFGPSLYYYKIRESLNSLVLAGEIKKNTDDHFLLLTDIDKKKIDHLLTEYSPIKEYPDYTVLYKKKQEIPRKTEVSRQDGYLKSIDNNMFWGCEWNGHIISNKTTPNLWETFSFITFPNRECCIKSYEGYYLCAELDNEKDLTATRRAIGSWEIFQIIELPKNRFALKAANSKFVCLDKPSLRLVASSNTIGARETFEFINKRDSLK